MEKTRHGSLSDFKIRSVGQRCIQPRTFILISRGFQKLRYIQSEANISWDQIFLVLLAEQAEISFELRHKAVLKHSIRKVFFSQGSGVSPRLQSVLLPDC